LDVRGGIRLGYTEKGSAGSTILSKLKG